MYKYDMLHHSKKLVVCHQLNAFGLQPKLYGKKSDVEMELLIEGIVYNRFNSEELHESLRKHMYNN